MKDLQWGSATIQIARGDITTQDTDAIVNAANSSLLGGGGVDGAIHHAGGRAILEECRTLGGCAPGDAKATTAGRLPARMVVHTVGPIYRTMEPEEADRVLSSAYRRSLEVAADHGAQSISFPSIATGAYGFPIERAATIACSTIRSFCEADDRIRLVRMVLFSDADRDAYARAASVVRR